MNEFLYVTLVGLVLGFGISIPVGPINILCIQKTLNEGRHAGLIAGMGASAADAIYGMIAAIGLSFVAEYLQDHSVTLRIVGGLMIIALGVKAIVDAVRGKTNGNKDDGRRHWIREAASHAGTFMSTFLLTLTNPVTILAFGAMFAALDLANHNLGSTWNQFGLFVGVFCGAIGWWTAVVMTVALFRERITPKFMSTVNKFAGSIMALCGLFIMLSPIVFRSNDGQPSAVVQWILDLIGTTT